MIRTLNAVVVDDEPMIRRGIARIIEQHEGRWNVLGTFADGMEALDFIRRCKGDEIDLLVTDIKMPEMDGIRLIREAARDHRFETLVISGYDDFDYVRQALKEGAFDYVLKPVDRAQFRRQLKELGDRIRRRRKREEIEMLRRRMTGDDAGAVSGEWERIFPPGSYRLCCAAFDEPPQKMRGYSPKDWELLLYALENIAEETVDERAKDRTLRGWVWREPPRLCWMLLWGEEDAEQLAEQVRAAAGRNLKATVTVAVGSPFQGFADLRQCRNEVLSLLYMRPIGGGNRVYAAVRPPMESRAAPSERHSQLGERFRLAIRQDRPEDALQLMREALRELETLKSHEALEQAVQAILLQIAETWMQTNPGKGRQFIDAEAPRVHEYTSSFARLCGKLEEWGMEASRAWRAARPEADLSPVDKAREWIRRHLSEPLTIALIAEQIPMHPTYFCELFKARTGETVLDYVTRVRMEEAARLLRETDLRLAEVAERVGYRDIKYFRSQFKKMYGVLPSQYKDIAAEESFRS